MTRRVAFSPEAQADLIRLYDYIAEHSGTERAIAYTLRITTHCQSFADFPERGTRRDDLRPGLRITGFGRRVTIAFHVTPEMVTIDRVLYAGRNLRTALARDV